MKWYNLKYVQHRDWILDNLEYLNLSSEESMLVLLIDFFNEKNIDINISLLSKKLDIDEKEVNVLLSRLVVKNYLKISANSNGTKFILDNLFEVDVEKLSNNLDDSIFSIFEREFKRPLNRNELEKLSDWYRTYDSRLLMLVLKKAVIENKININYMSRLIKDWQGLSIEKIEESKF